MFEGYAGTSDSGFRAEVEAEQALLRGNDLMAMIDQHAHTPLTGPAAAGRRTHDSRRWPAIPQFTGAVITDPKRLARVLKGKAGAILPRRIRNMCLRCPKSAVSEQQRRQERSSAARFTVNRSPARTSRSRSATSRN